MKQVLLIFLAAFLTTELAAQSKTTDALQKEYDSSLSLFFYKNTLRMLNQADNKEFDELIKDIEKLKFLLVDKSAGNFGPASYKKLKGDYAAEAYENVMTSRMDGRNFDIFMRDKKGSPLGTVVLVNDSSSLYVLDMIGSIDLRKAGALFDAIDQSTDIGQKIKSFTDRKGRHKEDKDEDKSDH